MKRGREAPIPQALVERLVDCAGTAVLVGGQALAFWVQRLGVAVPEHVAVISDDADFLSVEGHASHLVQRFAQVIGGETLFPSEHAFTALVGQAFVHVADDEYLNVDVLWRVLGLRTDEVAERAVQVQLRQAAFRVMHPLHVLRSRLMNLHKLPEKQNEKGTMQLALAIDVAREHLRAFAKAQSAAATAAGRSPVQNLVTEIERLAQDDAGRKVARRYGLHVADAIEPSLIPAGPFWTKRWPTLRTLMSPAYAARFTPPRPTTPRRGRVA